MANLDPRIDAMLRRDRRGVLLFVTVLWLTLLFVFYAAWVMIPDGTVRLVLAVSGACVLVLNTASMTALVRHYKEDKEHIYGLDLRFLDAASARRQEALRLARQEA